MGLVSQPDQPLPEPRAQPSPAEQQAEPPAEPKVDRGVGQAYLLFAICVCLMVSVGWGMHLWSRSAYVAITETLLVFLPAVLFVRLKRQPIAAALGWRKISPAMVVVSTVLGVSAMGVAVEIASVSSDYIGHGARGNLFEPATALDFVIGLLCGSILPGICEETLFRGAIQGTLGRLGPSKSVIITAILFALFHLDPWHFLAPLFFGIVLGIMTLRTGSTIPAMIVHASANAASHTVAYLFGYRPDARLWLVSAALSPVFVVVFSIFLAKTRNRAAPPDLLAHVPAALSRRALAFTVAATVTFVALAFFVFHDVVVWHYVSRDEEALGLDRGDRVLLVRWPLAGFPPADGDIVEIESDGRSRLVKVEHAGRNRVWLAGWPEGAPLDRQEITGRVVGMGAASKPAVP
jgi:hypothetical protein